MRPLFHRGQANSPNNKDTGHQLSFMQGIVSIISQVLHSPPAISQKQTTKSKPSSKLKQRIFGNSNEQIKKGSANLGEGKEREKQRL